MMIQLRDRSGYAKLKMIRPPQWTGMKKGQIIEVPKHVTRRIADRWVRNGRAEVLEDKGVETKGKFLGPADVEKHQKEESKKRGQSKAPKPKG